MAGKIHFTVKILQHEALTPGVKAWLLATYQYTPDPLHTYGAIVAVRAVSDKQSLHARQFPFTFVLADYQNPTRTAALLAAIKAAAQAELAAYLDTRPLTDLAEFEFAL